MESNIFSPASTETPRTVDAVLDEVNASFTRLKPSMQGADDDENESLAASRESSQYISTFWPQVARLIESDPAGLGMSVAVTTESGERRLGVEEIREFGAEEIRRSPAGRGAWADESEILLAASVLAPLTMMTELLNNATGNFAEELTSGSARCPLEFNLDPTRYVSLRALLPHHTGDSGSVGGNAATLMMGGTATALAMCWNLLHQMPRAYLALEGTDVDRQKMEHLWENTRELLFRIGRGSLSAFVAFASACSSDSTAMLWDRADGLGLEAQGGRYLWTMNSVLLEHFAQMAAQVREAQRGHYVGCAALYTRTDPLPLTPRFADAVQGGRQPTVFAELIRWVTAVARAEYFPRFAG
jgi:hypothetical protein